jgi:hypothetical protein
MSFESFNESGNFEYSSVVLIRLSFKMKKDKGKN